MNLSSKVRGILYVASAVLALALALLIAFGVITADQVTVTVTVAVNLFLAFTAALARLNLSPDA